MAYCGQHGQKRFDLSGTHVALLEDSRVQNIPQRSYPRNLIELVDGVSDAKSPITARIYFSAPPAARPVQPRPTPERC